MCEIFAGQPRENYEPVTRNIRLNGQSTSIRLERSFWAIVDGMAKDEGVSTPTFLSTLHSEVIEIHGEARNFTSLLRCACVKKIQLAQNASRPSMVFQSREDSAELENFSS
jgi:predicted DNA-binding ribbon-helix-helix protein